ncbi:glycosyltransferase family 39 protein [bacterium]|nr:glycosyltransferase family 39 protein [bacterium]
MIEPTTALSRYRTLLVWGAILAVYLTLALAGLSTQDLDGDELIASSVIHRLSPRDLIFNRYQEGNCPLYYLLAREWLKVFGHSLFTFHLFSVAIGAIAVFAMGGLARELGAGKWAAGAALLWAMHPTLQFYARYTRPMIGVLLFTTLAMWLTARAFRLGTAQAWRAAWIVGALGSFWNHMIAVAWIGLMLAVAVTPPWRRERRFWRAIAIILPLHLFNLLCVVWASSYDNDPMGWIKNPQGARWIAPFLEIIGGWTGGVPALIVSLAILAAAAWGAAELWRRRGVASPWRLVAPCAFLPIVVAITVTCLVKPMLIPRYLAVVAPGMFLFLVWALTRLQSHVAIACAIFIGAMMIAAAPANIARHRNGLFEAVGKLDQMLNRDTDKVAAFNFMTREALRLYPEHRIRAFEPPGNDPEFKKKMDENIGNSSRLWVVSSFNRHRTPKHAEWKKLTRRPFFNETIAEVSLCGYQLRPAK